MSAAGRSAAAVPRYLLVLLLLAGCTGKPPPLDPESVKPPPLPASGTARPPATTDDRAKPRAGAIGATASTAVRVVSTGSGFVVAPGRCSPITRAGRCSTSRDG